MTGPAETAGPSDTSAGVPPLLLPVLLVALGAAAGAALRWWLGQQGPARPALPWMTLAINGAGCFALASLPAIPAVRRSPHLCVLLGPGLLGGFTTVSTWAEESRALAADGAPERAAIYVVLTLASCLAAAALGRRLARSIAGPVP